MSGRRFLSGVVIFALAAIVNTADNHLKKSRKPADIHSINTNSARYNELN